jgi:putative endonuclease
MAHRAGRGSDFTSRYNIRKLVHFEETSDILTAIAREKQIKAGSRQRKLDLINEHNPDWLDLMEHLLP